MDKHDDKNFHLDPPAELDMKVFNKVAPVLKENRQIYRNKRWFQVWMPAASTVALTAFGFWFLNKRAMAPTPNIDTQIPEVADANTADMDLQAFAAMDMDEEAMELANNLELIEDLDLIEAYSEEENS